MMIKMVIADDEPVIVRGLQRLVDWEGMGIKVVGAYEDGEAAFYGILKEKPDIAILDISMPKMTGIELLKELHVMDVGTQVIFISGFSEFTYAVDALRYGAKGYLLKPVDKEELIHIMGGVIAESKGGHSSSAPVLRGAEENTPKLPVSDMPAAQYLPVCAELVFRQSDSQSDKLLRFALQSFFEDYMEQEESGTVITKEDSIFLIFKDHQIEEALPKLSALSSLAEEKFGMPALFIYGRPVADMRQIPQECASCLDKKRYIFFYDQLNGRMLDAHRPVFLRQLKEGEMQECKKRIQGKR